MIQNRGLLFMIGAIIIGAWTNTLLNFFFAHARVRFVAAWDFDIWRKIIHSSWPIALSIFFNLIYLKADTIILSLFRTQGEVGIYGAPYRVLETLATFPFLFVGLVFPVFTHAYEQGDSEHLRRTFQKTFDALAVLALPMVAGTLVLARPIMVLVAGDEFAASGPLLQILIIAAGFIFFGTLFGHLIVVAHAQKRMILGYAITACIALAGYIVFIPIYSYWGAAWMTVVAEGTILLLTAWMVIRTLALVPRFSIFLRAFGASVCMALALASLNTLHVLLLVPIGTVLYGVFLYLFRGIPNEIIRKIATP
ncbi:MAG: oligosaccharide flippase family protein [Candidatus Yonathbacteria bacterium]|nr:oligosaccharide flippase family protein [Candidatus Yonathbacteria bacterium]